MFRWIKKANRSKNYFLKRIKLKLKLNLLSMIAAQGRTSRTRHGSGTNHLIIPFIGKGIGDAIVIGGVIETLVRNNFQVSVIADKRTHFLFKEWRNLEALYFYEPNNKKMLIKVLRELPPFVFVDSHEITHSNVETFNLIRLIKPHKTIGFTRKYRIYDEVINISCPLSHISTRYIDFLMHLGISAQNYDYTVIIPDDDVQKAKDFLKKTTDKKTVAFIPYGSVSERFFSTGQIEAITSHMAKYKDTFHLIILGEQHKIKPIPDSDHVTKSSLPSFFSAAQIIKESALVISPDTSFVHVSRAFKKKLICLYPFKMLVAQADNADVWGPNYESAIQVRLKERRVMDTDVRPILNIIDEQLKSIADNSSR
ncbi:MULTISPECIES: glycosyltransferase family 9 protein [Enterobacter]|uniref:glycosyltransferase family 9 protein n=1 Tax=Enterobacter TaxID=547 RepID=UPI0007963745|nr:MULTISPECIES: glycosyltransferase family 9 protein [Enterobacter]ELP5692307.1 glycosyltransferase family 9 protein [Enterobacter ludwigii]EMD2743532.1 glycosyltransferase family 9 protein [Enterobacter ludwigii]MBG0632782.1 glycosyltransferase family 9 protein [Enterobacter ludwigii]MBX8879398.1 glycosyltransferase family 9 protein [Enterobacter ludwigii]MDC7312109.1 glycosyltransferase family 9 protein [Enterobacter ludwigii]